MSSLFVSMVGREWRQLFQDPWLFSLVTWIPAVIYFTIWSIFSAGIARDLPIGIVDLDKSRISRALIRHYDASPALDATSHNYLDVQQGSKALRAGIINGLVVIPKGLEKQTILGQPPQVTVFVNNQFLLIGKNINSALLQAHGTFTAGVEVVKNLSSGSPVLSQAISYSIPIGSQVTPLFNVSTNYSQFLVSAILPAIWQIMIVAATVLALGAENRRHGIQGWLKDAPVSALLAKFTPLILIFWLHGLVFLWVMYSLFHWPMNGSVVFLALTQLITVCASVSAASAVFFLTQDTTRSISMVAAYSAPGLAFLGITFPVTDMTLPAKIWRSLLPVSHYIEVQIAQLNYGLPIIENIPQIQHLTLFILPLLFTIHKVKKAGQMANNTEVIL